MAKRYMGSKSQGLAIVYIETAYGTQGGGCGLGFEQLVTIRSALRMIFCPIRHAADPLRFAQRAADAHVGRSVQRVVRANVKRSSPCSQYGCGIRFR
jgi:hypothetical protein